MRYIPYDANRCMEIISKMFSLAEMWGLRPDGSNPRKHIKKYPEEKRERFLSAAELRRVGEVLREMEEEGVELPAGIAAARLLMLTGCRLGEIMRLRWEHVDIEGRALRLPDSKTGAKTVHLGQPAVDVLKAIERIKDNPWVITGTLPGAPLYDLQPFWQRVRARAGPVVWRPLPVDMGRLRQRGHRGRGQHRHQCRGHHRQFSRRGSI